MASNSIIQCTSSSSHAIKPYDVFVSFRGEDTRNNFTDFLFQALRRNGIEAFKDTEDLKKGESIEPELLQAIQGSLFFVVIFSKNYASSTWCLRELVEMCNCIETPPKQLLPIFYDVDPSEVRKQSGYYDLAFTKHEETFREDKEKMEEVVRWRKTLSKVADFCGWHIGTKPQSAEIEEIVRTIKQKLGSKCSSLPEDNLVGMESRFEELERLLHSESINDVRFVGISGMGGVGKTTLVRDFFEKFSHEYSFRCFIEDVSHTYRKDCGALGVLKQLLSQHSKEKNNEICNVIEGTDKALSTLRGEKALIVIDNVDQYEQLNIFSGSRKITVLREILAGGSGVIIVSRDEQLLKTHGVHDVYKVKPLNRKDATQLFCRKAFDGDCIINGYEELTQAILWRLHGHPLTIEVIGSSLRGRDISYWKSTLATLRNNQNEDIMDKLRIGFDELNSTNKEIFLDIACLFHDYTEKYVKEILHFRGFYPDNGLQDLVDKSLITINEYRYVCMHELLRDLGKYIVREKSPNQPTKWSRLWDFQDLYKVMSDNMEETNVEAIFITSCPREFYGTTMTVNALSKMRNLKLLKLPDCIKYSGSLNDLSNELVYVKWPKFPFEFLPLCFQPHKLVELYLHESNIKQLWEGTKDLPKLRRLDLFDSKNLIKMQNLGEAINLKRLNLEGCIRLKQFDESSGFPKNLTDLSLKDCRSLINLPHFREALNLQRIDLQGCIQLKQIDSSIGFPKTLITLNLIGCRSLINLPHFREAVNLESMNLEGCTKLRQIDSSIGLLRKLAVLNLKDCKSLVSLPNSILELESLENLSLFGCSQLYSNQAREAKHSKQLCTDEAPSHSPSTSSRVKRWFLQSFPLYSQEQNDCFDWLLPSQLYSNQLLEEPRDAEHSKKLCTGEAPSHSQSTSSILKRWFMRLSSLYSREQNESVNLLLPSLSIFSCMIQLDLSFCNLFQVPDAIGNLHSLERLYLRGNNFAVMPSLKELSKLTHLNLEHCRRLEYLPELPSRTDISSLLNFSDTSLFNEYVFGLNTFNCPELAKREGCSNMCFPWITQILKADSEIPKSLWYLSRLRISSIIEGSEIPRWFKSSEHVCTDNSIIIDKSAVMHENKDWIGVACSAIFVARNPRGMAPPERGKGFAVNIPVLFREEIVTIESDHLWLFYLHRRTFHLFRKFQRQICQSDTKLMLKVVGGEGYDVEVKKYGYRFVCEKDLQQLSNLTMMWSETSSPRKRKFSAIEEME